MTDLRQVAQQALQALKLSVPTARAGEDDYAEEGWKEHNAAMVALKAALAEPVQEAVMYQWQHNENGRASVVGPFWGPLYLSSSQRPAEQSLEALKGAQEAWGRDETIRLALEAGLLGFVDNETPRHYFVRADIEQVDIEEFARLIRHDVLKEKQMGAIRARGEK